MACRIVSRNLCALNKLLKTTRSRCVSLRLRNLSTDKSDGNEIKRILSRSSILFQDGIDIRELPILVRRLDETLVPVIRNMTSLDDVQKVSEEDAVFKMRLQSCKTVRGVFRHLEIPADKVTPHTAAFALQRLCQLQASSMDSEHIDSFVRAAVMNELCENVVRGLHVISNDMVIHMVHCYQNSKSYSKLFIDSTNEEIEKRIGDGCFSIAELCNLTEHLAIPSKIFPQLLDDIVVHIGNRVDEINESTIEKVFKCLSLSASPSHPSVLNVLEKCSKNCWWKLSTSEIGNIIVSLMKMNHRSLNLLRDFCKQVFINIHVASEKDLMHVVTGCIHFNYHDSHLLSAVERFVVARGIKTDTNLIALIMEYCRCHRLVSPKIFDSVVNHIEANADKYDSLQLYSILRPYGQLNHQPKNAVAMFLKIEPLLIEKFDSFRISHMIELLASFVFLERFPINFVQRVFTPYVFTMVNNMKDETIRRKTRNFLIMLQSAIRLEWQDCRVPSLYICKDTVPWKEDRYFRGYCALHSVLFNLLGDRKCRTNVQLDKTIFFMDFVIGLDNRNQAVPLYTKQCKATLVVLLTMPEHLVSNTKKLLGEYVLRQRHIKLHGHKLIQVMYDDFYKRASLQEKKDFIQSLLQPYISQY